MGNNLNKYYKTKHVILSFSMLMFPFILPLPLPLNFKSISFIILLASLFFGSPIKQVNFRGIIKNPLVTICLLLFILDPLLSILRGNTIYLRDYRIPFLVTPALFLIGKNLLLTYRDKVLKIFVIGVFTYILCVAIYIIYFYFYYASDYKEFVIEYYLKYVTYHHFPNAIHHTYLGIYMSFSVAIILFDLRIKKLYKVVLNLVLLLFAFIIASKLTLFFIVFIIIYYALKEIDISKFKKFTFILGTILFTTSLIIFLYLKTDLFRTLENSLEKRIALIKCSLEGIKSNFFVGITNKNIKNYMNFCNNTLEPLDTHNLFLQEFLANGVLGVIVLASFIMLFFKHFFKAKLSLGIILILMFIFFGMIEHLINTQDGVLFFVFFFFFFYSLSTPVIRKTIKIE